MIRKLFLILVTIPWFWGCGHHTVSTVGPHLSGAMVHASKPKEEAARSRITKLAIRRSRTTYGQLSPTFQSGIMAVVCTFEVHGLPPGTRVDVLWSRGETKIARNELSTSRTTRSLSSALSSDAPLPSGTYKVEVHVGGQLEAQTTFRISVASSSVSNNSREEPTSADPGISDVTLTTTDECFPEEGGNTSRSLTFRQGSPQIMLCLNYQNIAPRTRLEIRWFRSSSSSPISVVNYNPEGDGNLSSSFVQTPQIPAGRYHVTVTLNGREVGRTRFIFRN